MKDPIVLSVGMAKFFLAGLFTLLFRFVTPMLGLSNVSPLMATELAGTKAYGPWVGGVYGFVGMIALDLCMQSFDPVRSFVTASCYGTVGIAFGFATCGRRPLFKDFLLWSILGTLFFDIITGCLMGPLLYGMPWGAALVGQIPFTAKHLAGNMIFSLMAPSFYSAFSNLRVELKLIGLDHVKI